MIAVLDHRGPDGYGVYRDNRVALAATRLSFLDLQNGFQPVGSEDGAVWAIFNGEIFNWLELREDLLRRGHRFTTASDAEVLVHGYESYGESLWGRLNGQFAIALWDGRGGRLWLVRDHFGIVPLYYARVPGGVVFASEIKALFAGGRLSPQFDGARIAQVFTQWASVAPATPFVGVRALRPGTAVAFDPDAEGREHRYWQLDLCSDPALSAISADEAAEELAERLHRSIELRLRADVPIGAYVSGGLDSSVIVSLMRQQQIDTISTFSVCFTDRNYDESREQRSVARQFATAHREVCCGPDAIYDALTDVVWHTETPLLRTAPAPMFLLSRLVRDSGLKAVLTGEGADELLGGYDIFKEDKIRRFWARDSQSRYRPRLLERLYGDIADASRRRSSAWRQFFSHELLNTGHPFYSHLIRWQNTGWTRRLLSPELRHAFHMDEAFALVEDNLPSCWRSWDPLARAQAIEIHSFLCAYLLSSQGDRVAMAHGVETRYPFLDPDVVAFCSRLPSRLKVSGLRDKVTLRRAGMRLLPFETCYRPKRPYSAPSIPALLDANKHVIGELLSPGEVRRFGMLDVESVTNLCSKLDRVGPSGASEREKMGITGVLTLQLLCLLFLEQLTERITAAQRRFARVPLRVFEDRSFERLTPPSPLALPAHEYARP